MQRKRAELSVQYTDAVNQYGPNFPKVQRIQAQIKDLDDQMGIERKGIVIELKSDYDEAGRAKNYSASDWTSKKRKQTRCRKKWFSTIF